MASHHRRFIGPVTELKKTIIILVSVVLLNLDWGGAQVDPAGPAGDDTSLGASTFRPGIGVIIGVLATMFSLTFLLLLYAKHCKRSGVVGDATRSSARITPPIARRDSGVERSVIEALPVFKFASLQGMKEGLECVVCLSRFEESEILRLLPKCKHAFHVDCVDTWLDAHSTCPLCRHTVEAEDVFFVDDLMADQDIEDGRHLQVFVQRDQNPGEESSRFTVDGSFRRPSGIGSWRRDRSKNGSRKDNNTGSSSGRRQDINAGVNGEDRGALLPEAAMADEEQFTRRFAHRIIVSDVLFKRRWSDFRASDLLFLSSQMIFSGSGRLSFSSSDINGRPPAASAIGMDVPHNDRNRSCSQIKPETGLQKNPVVLDVTQGGEMNSLSSAQAGRQKEINGKRAMSEIVGLSRFSHNNPSLLPLASRRDQTTQTHSSTRDTRWFSIARTTLQWLAGREKKT